MKTTDHRVELEEVMAYLDGELSALDAERVRAHMAGCGECQALERDLRQVSAKLQGWSVEDAPAGLKGPAPVLQLPRRLRGWLPVAAALVVAIGVVVLFAVQSVTTPPSSTDVAAAIPARSEAPLAVMPEAALPGQAAVPERSDQRTMKIVLGSAPFLARTARLTLVTDRFDTARAEMERILRDLGGFSARMLVTGTAEQGRALTATLQIPSARLDEAVGRLKAIGRVTSEGVEGEDVTQESVDLDARLENARNSEKRLAAILTTRTGDLEDVLAVERELARVRGEIESMEAQRKALDRRITYAAVEVQLTEEKRAAVDLGPQPLSDRFVDQFVRGWNGVLSGGVELGLLAARITPLAVVVALVIAPAVVMRRRRARRAQRAA